MAGEYAGSGGRGRRLREGVGVVREVGNDGLTCGAGASAIKREGAHGLAAAARPAWHSSATGFLLFFLFSVLVLFLFCFLCIQN